METSEPTSSGRHPWADCANCDLNEPDCIFVPSSGPDKADVVIVGEAPGYQEAKVGKPFSGPSGKLLDIVLKEKGIDRDLVFLTNACLCRPPNNATPSAKAVKCCSNRLAREVALRSPRTMVLLGNTASQSVLRTKDGVTKLRVGQGRTSDAYPGVRIIPTIHPAACLRQGDMFPSLVTDIGKINSNVTVGWEEPVFKVFDDPKEACDVLAELSRSRFPHIVVDIEVGVEKDEFDHPDRYDMLCVGISYTAGKAIVIGENACRDMEVRKYLRALLENKKIIAQNGKFDVPGLMAFCSTGATLWFDTMLASYAEDERPGTHSLGYLGTEILGAPDWKAEIDKYHKKGESYAVIPRKVLYKYNAWDACVTFLLYEYYEEQLKKEGLRELHDFLIEASNELMYPEMEGVLVDQEYNDYLMDHYLEGLEKLEREIHQVVGGTDFNPRSPKQVKETLALAGVRVASTDADTLAGLMEITKDEDVFHFCRLMLMHRKEQKLYGTYVKGIRKRLYRGRVHPTFLLHGTVSGRLSCRNPNLQNIPRDSVIRKQFVPAPGNVFLQGDYGQAELRVMATLAQDDYLRQVFNDPSRDLFDEVGTRLYGTRAVGDKELRIRTKAYVYGLSYGREEYGISMEYGIPLKEARDGMKAWMSLIPQLQAWQGDIKHAVLHEQEDLITTFGRHRRFWLITRENQKDVVKEALSFYPQSTASDICLRALIRLRKALGTRGNVRIPVHDSILAECRIEDAPEVARMMEQEMVASAAEWTDYVPFKVDIESGPSWGELQKLPVLSL